MSTTPETPHLASEASSTRTANRRSLGVVAAAAERAPLDTLVDQSHTAEMVSLAEEHGMSIRRGVHNNASNEVDFARTFRLTHAQVEAIGWYKGSGADMVNNLLRGNTSSVVGRKHMDTLLALFADPDSGLPRTKGGELVMRGGNGRGGEKMGLTSTTYDPRVAAGFAGMPPARRGAIQRLVLPHGLPYIPARGGEKEIILGPGLKLEQIGLHVPGQPTFDAVIAKLPETHAAYVDRVVDFVVGPPSNPVTT